MSGEVRLYNTLTGRKEALIPRRDRTITMYTCGPTVYDSTHVGHLIPPVVGDVLKRFLTAKGYRVIWAHNFTDVEDKIIRRAREEGVPPAAIAERYIAEYREVLRRLGIRTVDRMPRVTEHIGDIIEMIQGLIARGYAYVVDGDVYFDVARFPEYGKLSKRSPDEMLAGARVEVDPRKRNPMDFALWKAAKPGEPAWDSPWGPGRPGWHIECSVMALRHLGYPVDIHGGGLDLVFPHHENEIAQSEAYTGESPFVRIWLHSGLLQLQHEKMSKSLGNVVRALDVIERYGAPAVRLFILSHHYRSPREFGPERLEEARRAWQRLKNAVDAARAAARGAPVPGGDGAGDAAAPAAGDQAAALRQAVAEAARRFDEAMCDDLGTPEALAALYDLARQTNAVAHRPAPPLSAAERAALEEAVAFFEHAAGTVLGVLDAEEDRPAAGQDAQLVEALLQLLLEVRERARRERDWALADRIRARLGELGLVVEDTPQGPRVRRRTPVPV